MMNEQPAPPLPTGPRWKASAAADRSETRLRNALVELERRGEKVVDEVRALAPPRVATLALVGLGALLFVVAVRWASRPRRRRVRGTAPRSLTGELVSRAALGAAGVLGARLASEFLVPAMRRSLRAPDEDHDDEE